MIIETNMIVFIVLYIIYGIIWGVATNKILKNKGYLNENWFLWGFIFGIVAMLVALSKPDAVVVSQYDDKLMKKIRREDVLANGGWECAYCHSLNDYYITSCSCGKSKEDSEKLRKETENGPISS